MKIKNILNKINYSLVEKNLKKEAYHQIESSLVIKTTQINIPTIDETLIIFTNTFAKAKDKNIKTIKLSKNFLKQSKQLNAAYTNKIVGPTELKLYKNETFLAKPIGKKLKNTDSIWLIKIKNFSIEMPQENYLLFKYGNNTQKNTLKIEILISLYIIPLAPFFNHFADNIKKELI